MEAARSNDVVFTFSDLVVVVLSLLLVIELVPADFSCTSHGVPHGDVGGVLYRYTGASSDQWTQRRLADYVFNLRTSIVGSTAGTQPNILFLQLNNNHVFMLLTITCATVQCFFIGTLIVSRVIANCCFWC